MQQAVTTSHRTTNTTSTATRTCDLVTLVTREVRPCRIPVTDKGLQATPWVECRLVITPINRDSPCLDQIYNSKVVQRRLWTSYYRMRTVPPSTQEDITSTTWVRRRVWDPVWVEIQHSTTHKAGEVHRGQGWVDIPVKCKATCSTEIRFVHARGWLPGLCFRDTVYAALLLLVFFKWHDYFSIWWSNRGMKMPAAP